MGAVGRHRQVAALDLVLALRAGLDAREPVLDGKVDGAVIADLEMQEREIAEAAPVAAIERVAADEVERAGDIAPALAAPSPAPPARAMPLAQQVEEARG